MKEPFCDTLCIAMKPASKRRPSTPPPNTRTNPAAEASLSAARWVRRLFHNSYTRAGRHFVLKGWAVKIQHQDQRRTFSLWAKTKVVAAAEAKAIYDTILAEGWESALRHYSRRSKKQEDFPRTDARYWKERLLLRRYRFPASGESDQDLAARIDQAGTGYWFPLGTPEPEAAAVKARRIYQTVVEEGWEAACRQFSRELIVGFEWCSNPILWTYTTVHTLVGKRSSLAAAGVSRQPPARRVLIVEADAGIRKALEWCIDQQSAFRSLGCDSAESFAREFNLHKPQMVLLNRNLAERIGLGSPGHLAPIRPGVPALTYSVVVDGDQLFVSTPGGAEGYLLKRVGPGQLLEPILGFASAPELSTEDLLPRVKAYFKELLQSRSSQEASGLARLTPREREVLALLSKGCVDKEIAQAMGISAWTVHGHIKKIFERLNVRTRTEAVVRYLEK